MRKWTPLIAVSLGSFMLLVDVTIVNVALPKMALDLGASFTSLQWVIDIYAIALAALLLGAGGLADRAGRRQVYLGGLVVFASASLACGIAPDAGAVIVARAVQGTGAAAMFATTIALLNASYSGRERGIAFGVWGAINGAAAAAGPVLGGLLTQGLSWRWIFFVNLPVSVAAVALSARALPRESRRAGGRLDLAGIAAFTLCAGSLTYALTRAPVLGWTATSTLSLFAAAAAALVAFAALQVRGGNPILELSLLRRPSFTGVLIASLLLPIAAFSVFPYISLWLQSVRSMSPIGAGLAVLPLSIAALITSLTIGRVLHTASPRLLISAGLTLTGAGALSIAHLDPRSGWQSLTLGLTITGVGVGLATPALASSALAAVPVNRSGMAAGAVNTMRQLGYALGIAILGAVLIAHAPGAPHPHPGSAIDAEFASGLNAALLTAGTIGLTAALLAAILMHRTDPNHQTAAHTPTKSKHRTASSDDHVPARNPEDIRARSLRRSMTATERPRGTTPARVPATRTIWEADWVIPYRKWAPEDAAHGRPPAVRSRCVQESSALHNRVA